MWYYTENDAPVGPLSASALRKAAGVTGDTYVWREGMNEWVPLKDVVELKEPISPARSYQPDFQPSQPSFSESTLFATDPIAHPDTTAKALCTECSLEFPTNYLTRVPDRLVCYRCRPVWEQRIRESVYWRNDPGNSVGGFGARAYGYVVENLVWFGLIGLIFGSAVAQIPDHDDVTLIWATLLASILMISAVRLLIETWMLATRGSTMAHRITGLKVITSTGGKLGIVFSFLRSLLNMACILFPFGFVTVLLDEKKRAPVDFLLGTRVIFERK